MSAPTKEDTNSTVSGALTLLGVGTMFYQCWLASYLWAWHVVPHFHVPALNMWSLWGLWTVYATLTYSRSIADWKADPPAKSDDDVARQIDSVAYNFACPTTAFVIGWLIHVAT